MRLPLLTIVARVALAGLLIGTAPAETPYCWQNVVVGGGGFAPGIVFSNSVPRLAYLRADMGGAHRWEDAAARWTPLEDGLVKSGYQGVESIAPDPVNLDAVYMSVGMGRRSPAAILRSADRGRTWAIHPVGFAIGGNEEGRGLGERLATDSNGDAIRQVIPKGGRAAPRFPPVGIRRSSESGCASASCSPVLPN